MSEIVVADNLILEQELRQNTVESDIVKILATHYPMRDWFVDANLEGGTVDIRCASISMKYGMVIHLNKSAFEMNRRVYAAASELLERFKLSRDKATTGDEGDLLRDAGGDVLGAANGEYKTR